MRSNSCPKCQGPMTEGFLVDAVYGGNRVTQWAEGLPEKSIWVGLKLRGKKLVDVQSWRCQRCGYLENYARS